MTDIKKLWLVFLQAPFYPTISTLVAINQTRTVNMGTDAVNVSAALPELPQALSSNGPGAHGTIVALLSGYSIWQYVVTLVLGVLVYDQGEQGWVEPKSPDLPIY